MSIQDIIYYMSPGSERRRALVDYMKKNPDTSIYINRRYCIQLQNDNDLKQLLKKKILKRIRDQGFSMRSRYTRLVLSIVPSNQSN